MLSLVQDPPVAVQAGVQELPSNGFVGIVPEQPVDADQLHWG